MLRRHLLLYCHLDLSYIFLQLFLKNFACFLCGARFVYEVAFYYNSATTGRSYHGHLICLFGVIREVGSLL